MKRCFRAMYLFVPIVIFLLVSIGCARHQYCVDWDPVYKVCHGWSCTQGYVRDKENPKKCIPEKEWYDKYDGWNERPTPYYSP
jgi:hypothetical protein